LLTFSLSFAYLLYCRGIIESLDQPSYPEQVLSAFSVLKQSLDNFNKSAYSITQEMKSVPQKDALKVRVSNFPFFGKA